ncbi:hypothetical protein HPB49_020093 [Dermacentor silvarum]|uniref:Uncharacterized protein n=1 Tax=Dermacentor silvarum TaxID=543639 RepID=A0ACB8C5G5_DERSI|nr:hypothetical protein HPB49_020093 [Dermacentor silvarum]
MLRNLATSEQRRLLDCYNNIWWSGQVPEAWRTAIVAPILKSNKPANELSSYRPVSLTSAACKVMEAIALARLEWVARACGFLADQQTGFRRRRCTADSIADVVSPWRTPGPAETSSCSSSSTSRGRSMASHMRSSSRLWTSWA